MEKYQLTLNNILKYIADVFSDVEVAYLPPHGNNIRSTYGKEYERILRLADGLAQLGVRPGDRVATLDWNTIWHFDLYWAVPGMGAVLHPLNVRLAPEDLVYIINHAQDKVLIYHRDFAPLVEKLRPYLKVQTYIQITDGLDPASKDPDIEDVIKQGQAKPLPNVSEDTVATIGYTSGTTGKPKGAYFTHRALVLHTLTSAIAFVGYRGFPRPECATELCTFLQLVPMFHVHGWGTPWSLALLGWRQIYPGRFDPNHVVRLIAEERVKFLAGVPTVLYMLLTSPEFPKYAEKIKQIRPVFIVGGAALSKELARRAAEAGFIPRVGYGMTETAPILTLGVFKPTEEIPPETSEEYYDKLTATGLPIPLVDLMVADENLNPVPKDGKTIGEIVVRAPWVTPEYLGDPEKTREAWKGGWFHTGDVAVWLPDGRVRIVDRAKDVIKSGGEWISSIQLEDLIATHPAVAQVAVIGVPHEKWGERPVAVVVLKPGATATEDDIKKHLEKFVEAGKIPKWWIPDKVIFIGQLPLTGTGKVDKKVLREQFKAVLK